MQISRDDSPLTETSDSWGLGQHSSERSGQQRSERSKQQTWPPRSAAAGADWPERYVLTASGVPATSDEVEQRARLAIEVVVLWRGDVLAVRHVAPPGAFHIGGEDSVCDVALPSEWLGTERLCIAVGSRNEVSAVLPPHAHGWLTLPDGSARELAPPPPSQAPGSFAGGTTTPVGERLLPLGLGYRAHLCFADIELQVAAVAAGRAPAGRRSLGFESSTLAYFGLSSLSVAGVLVVLSLMAPPLGLTQDERVSQERLYRLQSYLSAAAERVVRQQEEQTDAPARGAAALRPPRSRYLPPPRSRYEPPPPEPEATAEQSTMPEPLPELEAANGEPRTAADRKGELEQARSYGMISLLGESLKLLNDPRLKFRRELSSSELAEMDRMYNDPEPIWDEGPGGLALSGTGRRGGGKAQALPLEAVSTVSGGEGTLPEGYEGFGNPSGSHRPSSPQLRQGREQLASPSALERSSPASVRRAIHAQFSLIRACYEEGLRSHPALPGKALVSFVLQPDGHAAQVSAESSDLPAPVVRCIEGVFRDLRFPQTTGPVPVEVPVQLTPQR